MLLHYAPPLTPYLDILYQDDAVVVFNKPSGLLTVPGKAPEHKDSLEYRARLVWPGVRVVHRLDMATSGVVVMALNADSQRELNRQFQQRETKKHYIAGSPFTIPEPSSTLSLLALGTLGAASTLKRKLKSSKSSEKETTKVS